jgi:hypothetical protein
MSYGNKEHVVIQVDQGLKAEIETLTTSLAQIATNVRSFGAKGDGVTDDTQAIKNALASGKRLHFPLGSYRITSSIVFEKHVITADEGTEILKDFDGVGVFVVGGAVYTYVNNLNVKGFNAGISNAAAKNNSHGIVVIGGRVNFHNVKSYNHRGNGVEFIASPTSATTYSAVVPSYSCNMNKCVVDNLLSYGNDGYGVRFAGTQDDMSVWKFSIYTQANRGSGVYVEVDCMFRDSVGLIYSENDGLNTVAGVDHSVYIGKLRNSFIECYAEGQSNLNCSEILLDVNCLNTTVISLRGNRDTNNSTQKTFVRKPSLEYRISQVGIIGGQPENVTFPIQTHDLAPLSTRNTWFSDINYLKSSNLEKFLRAYGADKFVEYLINTAGNAQKINNNVGGDVVESYNATFKEIKQKSNGTLASPTDVVLNDVLYSLEIQGMKNGAFRSAGKVDFVASNFGTGKLGCDIVFYTKNADTASTYVEAFRINQIGDVVIPKLAGAGDRPLLVDATGKLKV